MSSLSVLLAAAGQPPLAPEQLVRFTGYLDLILRWNARTNLTAVRERDQIESRHFLESIVCARAIPPGVTSLLDFGSGAGFPGLPIAICRPEIQVTLAESQGKKAAFLREVFRALGLPGLVHGGRAEQLEHTFDCVTLRAVDKMQEALRAAVGLVAPGGWLVVMSTAGEQTKIEESAGSGFVWAESLALPGSEQRLVYLGQKETGRGD